METIELIYKRPPDRVNHFPQNLLYEDDDVIVTTQRNQTFQSNHH